MSSSTSCPDWGVTLPAKYLQNLQPCGTSTSQEILRNFDSPQLAESAIEMVETFFGQMLRPSTDMETFDDLRLTAFNNNVLKIDFEKTLCTSTNYKEAYPKSLLHRCGNEILIGGGALLVWKGMTKCVCVSAKILSDHTH